MTHQIGNDDARIAAIINRAIELDRNHQTSFAVELVSRLAEEFPQAAGVHAYLAWFLLQAHRGAEAIEHARQAVKLAPRSEKASLIYFFALWKLGRHSQALDEMKRFIVIRPSKEYSTIIKDWKLDVN